jgi:hypothetical protein
MLQSCDCMESVIFFRSSSQKSRRVKGNVCVEHIDQWMKELEQLWMNNTEGMSFVTVEYLNHSNDKGLSC